MASSPSTFTDPIEKVIIQSTGTNTLSFVNAGCGAQLRRRGRAPEAVSGSWPAGWTSFNVFANTTLMNSEITPGNEGISALTNPNRPMVGQSEYVVNAGLGYASRSGAWAANLLYNVAGRRILEAGVGRAARRVRGAPTPGGCLAAAAGDLDLHLKLDGKNLLDSPYRITQGGGPRTGTTPAGCSRWRFRGAARGD